MSSKPAPAFLIELTSCLYLTLILRLLRRLVPAAENRLARTRGLKRHRRAQRQDAGLVHHELALLVAVDRVRQVIFGFEQHVRLAALGRARRGGDAARARTDYRDLEALRHVRLPTLALLSAHAVSTARRAGRSLRTCSHPAYDATIHCSTITSAPSLQRNHSNSRHRGAGVRSRRDCDPWPQQSAKMRTVDTSLPENRMSRSPEQFTTVASCVDRLFAHCGAELRVAAPLGLGKPNVLINALYERVAGDASLRLDLYTALSLAVPKAKTDLERRFLGPFLARHFGADYPDLAYVAAQKDERLPANIRVQEFYLMSGAMLGVESAQRNYASMNYTHVARDLVDRRINLVVQLIAAREEAGEIRYSLACNPDVTADLLDQMQRSRCRTPVRYRRRPPRSAVRRQRSRSRCRFLRRIVVRSALPSPPVRIAARTGRRGRVRDRPAREHARARRWHAADRHRRVVRRARACAVVAPARQRGVPRGARLPWARTRRSRALSRRASAASNRCGAAFTARARWSWTASCILRAPASSRAASTTTSGSSARSPTATSRTTNCTRTPPTHCTRPARCRTSSTNANWPA